MKSLALHLHLGRLAFCAALLLCDCSGADLPTATFVSPDYGDPCRKHSCSGLGACVSQGDPGVPACMCDDGYAGERCGACAVGFHRDANDHCVYDTVCADQAVDPCGIHGECNDDEGVITCRCDRGYDGARCTLCSAGYASDAWGDCLQKVLLNGQAVTVSARCDADACHGHGTCSDHDGLIECACYLGYSGARCDACAGGYTQPADSDRCVTAASACDASGCGSCVAFDGDRDFPAAPDTCISRGELQRADMLLRSVGGEGTVWLCAASQRYGFASEHIALEAGAKVPAEIRLGTPIVSIAFDYAAWDTLSFDVLGDRAPVDMLSGVRHAKNSVALSFDPPITVLGFQSTDGFGHTLALDNIIYEPALCQ